MLAVIDMPELEKEVEREEAAVQQAEAHVVQMKAAVETAKADYAAAKALIGEREADVEDAESMLTYNKKVFDRIAQLARDRGIEQAVVDEKEEKWHASKAALSSAKASVTSAEAQASAAKAKIDQANADLVDAQAKVEVAKASLAKSKVMLGYTKITSPYTGVITARNFFEGDFINARDQGATTPLLVVDETDWMRVVLQVPDLEVPYTNPGDVATVEIDALPNNKFDGKVSRLADSEDPQTRTMRTEVDLENKEGILRDGMYGKVTIVLQEASKNLTVPSSAVHVDSNGEHAAGAGNHRAKLYLWVVRGGKAHKQSVQVGTDNGISAEILTGLKPDDEVVVDSRTALNDGAPVAIASNGTK